MDFSEFIPPSPYPTVFFGRYFIPDSTKPFETFISTSIEWIVAEQDRENGRALLVSKYALDWEGFAGCALSGSHRVTSWETSYIREWLNETFYEKSFYEWEKKNILPVFDDKIFLLSADEVRKYFPSEQSAVAYELMIDGKYEGTVEQPIEIDCLPTTWWTRTSGKTADKVVVVDCYGRFDDAESTSDEIGIRPAMWVEL